MATAVKSTEHDVKDFAAPEETRNFPLGKIEVIRVGDNVIGKATFQPGWKWSKHVKPIAGTPSCQCAHLVHQISGRMRIRLDDGTEFDIGPGEVAYIPPNHDGWVIGDEPVVAIDWAGMKDYAKKK